MTETAKYAFITDQHNLKWLKFGGKTIRLTDNVGYIEQVIKTKNENGKDVYVLPFISLFQPLDQQGKVRPFVDLRFENAEDALKFKDLVETQMQITANPCPHCGKDTVREINVASKNQIEAKASQTIEVSDEEKKTATKKKTTKPRKKK